MKATILLSMMTLLFAVVQIDAQAHDNSKGGCRLAKNHIDTGYMCPACEAIDKKEADARKADDKKRIAAAVAKGQADKLAANAAHKKKMAEMAANHKVTEVKVVMSKEPIAKKNNSNSTNKYTIVNEYKLGDSQYQNYNSKIMLNNKVVFESNDFLYIKKIDNENLFIGTGAGFDDCKLSYSTNKDILLDANFKKVNLQGIDKFYYGNTDGDNENYFNVSVLTTILICFKNTCHY